MEISTTKDRTRHSEDNTGKGFKALLLNCIKEEPNSDLVGIKEELDMSDSNITLQSKSNRLHKQLLDVLATSDLSIPYIKEEPIDEVMVETNQNDVPGVVETADVEKDSHPLDSLKIVQNYPSVVQSHAHIAENQSVTRKPWLKESQSLIAQKVQDHTYSVINSVDNCLVCYAPCCITKNRKIPTLPFCKKCKKAYFYQLSQQHKGRKRYAPKCPAQGHCVIDYRVCKICPYCHHKKFKAILLDQCNTFKNTSRADILSKETIAKYRWEKKRCSRRYSCCVKNNTRKCTSGLIESDAKLIEEALISQPRVMVYRMNEADLQLHTVSRKYTFQDQNDLDWLKIKATQATAINSAEILEEVVDTHDKLWQVMEEERSNFQPVRTSFDLDSVNISQKPRSGPKCALRELEVKQTNQSTAEFKSSGQVGNLRISDPVKRTLSAYEKAAVSEFNDVPKLTDDRHAIKVFVFQCGHACSKCNSAEGLKWLHDNGYSSVEPSSAFKDTSQWLHDNGDPSVTSSFTKCNSHQVVDCAIVSKLKEMIEMLESKRNMSTQTYSEANKNVIQLGASPIVISTSSPELAGIQPHPQPYIFLNSRTVIDLTQTSQPSHQIQHCSTPIISLTDQSQIDVPHVKRLLAPNVPIPVSSLTQSVSASTRANFSSGLLNQTRITGGSHPMNTLSQPVTNPTRTILRPRMLTQPGITGGIHSINPLPQTVTTPTRPILKPRVLTGIHPVNTLVKVSTRTNCSLKTADIKGAQPVSSNVQIPVAVPFTIGPEGNVVLTPTTILPLPVRFSLHPVSAVSQPGTNTPKYFVLKDPNSLAN